MISHFSYIVAIKLDYAPLMMTTHPHLDSTLLELSKADEVLRLGGNILDVLNQKNVYAFQL